MGGDTDQYLPDLTYDNHPVPVPKTPEEGYHLNIDLADKAIEFIQDAHVNAPEKPFFLYYATGAGHAPHHVEPEWIEKHKGKFDMGWDAYRKVVFERQKEMGILPAGAELSAHDPDVPEWDSLSDEAKKMYAHQMEVYAAFIEQTDYHFGRIIEFLEMLGELDNTIVVVISDNGASAEGGVHGTFNETLFFNGVEETLEDNLEHYDEWGSPNTFPTTRGAGPGPAIPPSAAGSGRPIAAASATPASCSGRRESRPATKYGRNTLTSLIWYRRCWKRWTSKRRR